jgi:hypothetical protein
MRLSYLRRRVQASRQAGGDHYALLERRHQRVCPAALAQHTAFLEESMLLADIMPRRRT